jgi:hypothetical protein
MSCLLITSVAYATPSRVMYRHATSKLRNMFSVAYSWHILARLHLTVCDISVVGVTS